MDVQDLNSKTSREESTETDPILYDEMPSTSVYSNERIHKDRRHGRDSASPGRAVVHLRFGWLLVIVSFFRFLYF